MVPLYYAGGRQKSYTKKRLSATIELIVQALLQERKVVEIIEGHLKPDHIHMLVSTVGLNEATIRKYIQDQERYDIMQDKLSVKEYEEPFKRGKSK